MNSPGSDVTVGDALSHGVPCQPRDPGPKIGPILDRMDQFVDAWAAAWAEFGSDEAGRPTYARLLESVRSDVISFGSKQATLQNEWPLNAMFKSDLSDGSWCAGPIGKPA